MEAKAIDEGMHASATVVPLRNSPNASDIDADAEAEMRGGGAVVVVIGRVPPSPPPPPDDIRDSIPRAPNFAPPGTGRFTAEEARDDDDEAPAVEAA